MTRLIARTLKPASALMSGDVVWEGDPAAERVVSKVRPYRLFVVVEFMQGQSRRYSTTTQMTVWRSEVAT